MKYSLCIPLCDPSYLPALRTALQAQRLPLEEVLILDSSRRPIREHEWPLGRVRRLSPSTFDHGGARRIASKLLADADVIIFLTQDALPADQDALANLATAFADLQVGAAFGRQLPRPGAGGIESHARLFNYPAEGRVTSSADAPRLGIKTAFISNSFAAYRRSALDAIGDFPERNIVSEDTLVAARMLRSGWRIAYRPEARVYHSHFFTLTEEFQRYFDIGVFHAREPWILQTFGKAEKEGRRFIASELKFLFRHHPAQVISALVRLPVRYFGFRAGLWEAGLPSGLKRRLSRQKSFWKQEMAGIALCSRKRPSYSPD